MKPRVSSRDVALEAGVSKTTVSYVLSGRQDISIPEATRRRVQDAARRLGYRVNGSARSVRTGRFDCIGLVLSTHPSYSTLARYTLGGINQGLAAQGYHLTVATLSDAELTDDAVVPKMLGEWMVDGLLLNYSQAIPPRLQRLVDEHQIPTIWMNSRHEADCVYPDDRAAARGATERLLALGHARIAYGGHQFPPETALHYSVPARAAGYADAMAAAQTPPRWFEVSPPPGADRAEVRRLLSGPGRPTAVVTYWPSVANVVLCEALALGLRVPEDLTILTFSDQWLKEEGLPVSTWLIPSFALGEQAVEMLLHKIADPARRQPPRPLSFLEDRAYLGAPGPQATP
jgi:LacI family transcriptional regulator